MESKDPENPFLKADPWDIHQQLSNARCLNTSGLTFGGNEIDGQSFIFKVDQCNPYQLDSGSNSNSYNPSSCKNKTATENFLFDEVFLKTYSAQTFIDKDDFENPIKSNIIHLNEPQSLSLYVTSKYTSHI